MRQSFTWVLHSQEGFELEANHGLLQLHAGLCTEHSSIVSDDRFVDLIHAVLLTQSSICPHPRTQPPDQRYPCEQSPTPRPKRLSPTSKCPLQALCSGLLEDSYLLQCRAGRHQWWQPLLVAIQNVTPSCGICKVRGTLAGSRDRQLKVGSFQGKMVKKTDLCSTHEAKVAKPI